MQQPGAYAKVMTEAGFELQALCLLRHLAHDSWCTKPSNMEGQAGLGTSRSTTQATTQVEMDLQVSWPGPALRDTQQVLPR